MITKLLPLCLMICHISLCAQEIQTDLKKYTPKRFIDKVEVITGPSLHFPDDNGWSDYVKNNSQGSIYHIKKKVGYSLGIGLIHSFPERFEIHGKILVERKGYIEDEMVIGENNDIIEFNYNSINDYI